MIPLQAVAQLSNSDQKKADHDFKNLDTILYLDREKDIYSYLKKDSLLFRNIFLERMYNKYRMEGSRLWDKYPKDPKRYEWLVNTLRFGIYFNHYWIDIEEGMRVLLSRNTSVSQYSVPIDWSELRKWERLQYKMLQECKIYFKEKGEIGTYKSLLAYSVSIFLRFSFNKEYGRNGKLDFTQFKKLFIPAAKEILDYEIDSNPESYMAYIKLREAITILLSNYRAFGLNEIDMELFFDSLENYPNISIQRWTKSQRSIFSLMSERDTFQFKHNAVNGEEIDFQKMRGKVVLVDFWATWCTGCIGRMPAIRKIYDKYKDRGFVVVSACLNDESATSDVKDIINRIGADWPVALIGKVGQKNTLGALIWQKYKFWGVPQLLLFNKKGKLVLLNDILSEGDFSPLINKLIKETY
ncbi:TlpA disulfide reductase family protein [Chitinophaga sp. SYP-B3965]|uniref:TlpA family protein disulfide reductase n=1 Tax=Chitinophaga sp. SYP-B3965 TaxID=2663120 RepID=UPI0015640D22|nr:TlpA disulfide reductase family protein [Chitinophaga sp. SYP-B3965]